MTGRVLIVDDLEPNVKLLEAKLAHEYYDYESCFSGAEALEKVKIFQPDIILLDVMMPEMDGFEVCRHLKSDKETAYIPVVMVTALSETRDRITGLEAGADDFITKPIDDIHLFARIKSLIRIKLMIDELRLRDKTDNEFGVLAQEGPSQELDESVRILIIEDDIIEAKQITDTLSQHGCFTETCEPKEAHDKAIHGNFDLLIVSTQLDEEDGLRLCMHIRSQNETRRVPQLILVDADEREKMIKGLEMGVNDYLLTPVEPNELVARVRTQIRRKRYQDALRSNYEESLSMAVMDSLTKLYNRNYLDAHLVNIVEQAKQKNTPLSVMTLDIDNFKEVNDKPGWGHHIGDEVLKEIAERILQNIRSTDLATRPGGEEFVIVMPSTNLNKAKTIAQRVHAGIGTTTFPISADPGNVHITVSIGLSELNPNIDTHESLLQRADKALYQAKNSGRNQIIVAT
jgi:two-component system cell cycle response regulator